MTISSRPLDGGWAKIDRAKEHLETLKKKITDFRGAGDTHRILRDYDPTNGEHVFKIQIIRNLPQRPWGLIIGDCIHNARTALDHLFWALILQKNPNGIQESTAHFPILHDRGTFLGRKRKIVSWIGSNAAAVIERLQPYQRGNQPNDPLMFLHSLDIRDKHKLLLPFMATANENSFKVTVPPKSSGKFELRFTLGAVENEAEIARIKFIPPNPTVEVNLDVTLDVIIDVEAPGHWIAVPSLQGLIKQVENVLDLFTPFFVTQTSPP